MFLEFESLCNVLSDGGGAWWGCEVFMLHPIKMSQSSALLCTLASTKLTTTTVTTVQYLNYNMFLG